MNARTQYELTPADLSVVLELCRGAGLAQAGARLGLDASTVFRSLKRIEKGLGQRLFERTRAGYRPTDLALRLVQHAETIESELQAARGAAGSTQAEVSGVVRISAVDAVLNHLVAPALASLIAAHPQLRLELDASNELSSLTRRDVDIALRSTRKPASHLVGKRLGTMRFAVYAQDQLARRLLKGRAEVPLDRLAGLPWVAVDEAMGEHPGVVWRKRQFPAVLPAIQANSSLTATAAIEAGLGIGVVALFHARNRPKLKPLTAPLAGCEMDLWMLTHPESRHLRRIAAVARHLAGHIELEV